MSNLILLTRKKKQEEVMVSVPLSLVQNLIREVTELRDTWKELRGAGAISNPVAADSPERVSLAAVMPVRREGTL